MSPKAKQLVTRYRGSLDATQAAEGMNAAASNARRLAEDALTLLNAKRFPSAIALAILSIEEHGKNGIIRALTLAKQGEDLSQQWKEYRSHTSKNIGWILPELAAKGARKLDDLKAIVDVDSDHPQVLDDIKQFCTYTDCVGNGRWSRPSEVATEKFAKQIVHTADIFSQSDRIFTVRELELWIQHMGPVWKGPMPWMSTALIEWDKAMRAEGLATGTDMESFVRGVDNSQNVNGGQP